jgi:acyl-coenzyme A thioesterase PaaI-like protein
MSLISQILPSIEAPGNPIRTNWDRMHTLPGGKAAFSKMIGMLAPYSGSIGARVEDVKSGYARCSIRDRRKVRNHLRSVHAIALVNLAEITGNLALGYSMPDDARFIPTGIDIKYIKKARGTITCIAECPIPETSESTSFAFPVQLFNDAGEVVAEVTLTTLVGPKRS